MGLAAIDCLGQELELNSQMMLMLSEAKHLRSTSCARIQNLN